VAVTGPGVGKPDPLQPVPVFGARRSPQAECAVYMGPCTVRASNRNKLRERVVGTDVEIAGLKQNNGRLLRVRVESLRQDHRRQLTLIVARQGNNGALPKTQHSNGSLDRAVMLAARQDADRGGAKKTLLLHIPPACLSNRWRADARHTRCAICVPVTNAKLAA
jgi:hypothetical protein